MTIRGCAYAGSKGVVWGPIKDMIHISHGPVGCGQYSRAGRRNYYVGTTGVDTFGTMNFTSDFQEKDIVFGGDKKLAKLIDEIEQLFPLHKGISVQSECPIGLIGDDIEGGAKKGRQGNRQADRAGALRRLPRRFAVARPPHRQRRDPRLGPRQARRPALRSHAVRRGDHRRLQHRRRRLGSRILLEEMGLRVVAQWSGDGTLPEIENTPKVKLNLLHCYRSMNYISRHMEEKYGIPWLEYNFFGPTKIAESLRAIAAHFDDTIKEGAERVIAKYQPMMDAIIAKYKPRLQGKKVMLYVGGLRPRHVIGAYEDLGMEVIGTGYEFAHNDDYDRTIKEMGNATLLYDDATGFELEEFVKRMKPDLVGSGIKEKYVFQKMGIPLRQMHSWDYSGPYHGYDGFAIFARDMDMTRSNPCWSKQAPPWKKLGGSRSEELKKVRLNEVSLNLCPRPQMGGRAKEMKMQTVDDIKPCYPLFRETTTRRSLKNKRDPVRRSACTPEKVEEVFALDDDEGIPGPQLQARGADRQPGQGLPAARRRAVRLWVREDPALCAWLAGLRAYFRTYFNRHFKEPICCIADSMTEDAAVFGGQKNMFDGLENAKAIYKPEMIAVSTTCMAEVIGDDLNAFINNAKKEGHVPDRTSRFPSPYPVLRRLARHRLGQHVRGHHALLHAEHHGRQGAGQNGKINIVPGFETYLGNFRVIKRMMAEMGVDYTLLSDPTEVLDTPADGEFRMYAGGTTQDEIKDAPNAITPSCCSRWPADKTRKLSRTPGTTRCPSSTSRWVWSGPTNS
jgi:nitrogenase molybdenum-iron protein alpha chain